jgi:hypothetical protein
MRGVVRRGAEHHNTKLKEADVLEIRRRFDAKERTHDIAARFSVSVSRVSDIGRRRSWSWLPEQTNTNDTPAN